MNAQNYDRSNWFQMRDGKQLIDRISNDFGEREIECILDIGCGTGNLTVILNQLAAKRIIGVDIDEEVIAFAEQNNTANDDCIEYMTQDLTVDWNQLRPELRALEGKVSSQKGSLVSYLIGKILAVPPKETQEKEWNDSFKMVGFKIIHRDHKKCNYEIEQGDFDEYVAPMGLLVYQEVFGYSILNVIKTASNWFGIKHSSLLQQQRDESTGRIICDLNYEAFTYILGKY